MAKVQYAFLKIGARAIVEVFWGCVWVEHWLENGLVVILSYGVSAQRRVQSARERSKLQSMTRVYHDLFAPNAG